MGLVVALSAVSPQELKHKPWIEKEWTKWTVWDCSNTFNYSPWVYRNQGWGREKGPVSNADPNIASYAEEITIEFLSALPIREAKLRGLQNDQHYDRMSPQKRQAFDQQHANDLVESASDPVRISYGRFFAGRITPAGHATPLTQIALRLADGSLVMPSETNWVEGETKNTTTGWGVEYVFPRNVNGKPLYSPNDKEISIVFGNFLGFNFDKNHKHMGALNPRDFHLDAGAGSIDFPITDMMYKGKLEY
jgi:hypothetical protein